MTRHSLLPELGAGADAGRIAARRRSAPKSLARMDGEALTSTLCFRPLAETDCELIAQWRAAPHVARWFGPTGRHEDVVKSYLDYISGAAGKRGHLVLLNDRPIGLVECYRIEDQPRYFANLGVTEPGSAGMDIFIGLPEEVGKGLGTQIIRCFIEQELFASGAVAACYVAPDVSNRRSIRAFQRAGFVRIRDIQVPGDDAPAAVLRIVRSDVQVMRPPALHRKTLAGTCDDQVAGDEASLPG